jgi:serine/threonine-protein kinase
VELTRTIAVGERFADRYRVERLLGRGGMGAVYAVVDETLDDRVALKVLFTERAMHEQALARFQREVRLARRVTSPHVARTHDIGVHDGVHYLTMELIEGESLKERLAREGALPLEAVLRIGKSLAQGLASAHEAGVIHRDLKPANVMLGEDDRVAITDFGIARPVDRGDDVVTIGFIGTPRYMAPEVFDGGTFDERSDLYALGIIFREMLTGKRYRLSEVSDDEPTRVDTQANDGRGPPALQELVRSMLRLAPEGRPASARAVADELAAIARDPDETLREPSVPLPRGRRMLVVPFRARGGDEAEEFAEVLTEELVDVLARNLGFVVVPHRASDDDTLAAGASADAEWVISGTVARRGSRVRISVRLAEVKDGAQLFSERFDAEVEDVFDLQDRIAKRVGEALREEVTLVARRGSADAEAVELYLRGRRKYRSQMLLRDAGLPEYEAAIARAPDFGVAVAAHAIASVRRWWIEAIGPEGERLQRAVDESVARALRVAPDLAETHLAAGIASSHRGDYAAAVESLERALDIAPTCALAQDYLGQLECEAGRGNTGSQRILLAHTLDPVVLFGQAWIARWHALSGRPDEGYALLDELDRELGGPSVNRLAMRMRIAAWRHDHETLKWCRDRIPVDRFGGQLKRLCHYVDLVLGTLDADAYHPATLAMVQASTNDRFTTFALQLCAEAYALIGRADRAAEYVSLASRSALADLDWLERCPALAQMRELPSYPVLQREVEKRAHAIWRS